MARAAPAARPRPQPGGEAGAALVEGTLGTCLLLLAALLTLQVALVFHGALAARTAANHTARTYALTRGDEARARASFEEQRPTTMGMVRLKLVSCQPAGDMGLCRVEAAIPVVLPGSSLLVGGSVAGPLLLTEVGAYPWGLYGRV